MLTYIKYIIYALALSLLLQFVFFAICINTIGMYAPKKDVLSDSEKLDDRKVNYEKKEFEK